MPVPPMCQVCSSPHWSTQPHKFISRSAGTTKKDDTNASRRDIPGSKKKPRAKGKTPVVQPAKAPKRAARSGVRELRPAEGKGEAIATAPAVAPTKEVLEAMVEAAKVDLEARRAKKREQMQRYRDKLARKVEST